jgi:hypothetical protein
MAKIKIRSVTILLLVVAALFAVVGVIYVADTAAHLPTFFPGHDVHLVRHHYTHSAAAFMLALAAVGGAWLTTAPDRQSTA